MKPSKDQTAFEHYHSAYKCCCGAVHVKQGSLLIAIVSSVLIIFAFLSLILATESNHIMQLFQVGMLLVEMFCVYLLFRGLSKEKELYLLPYLVMQALTMFTVFVLIAASAYALYDTKSLPGDYFERQMLEQYEGSHIDDSPKAQEERRDILIKVTAVFTIISCLIGEVVAVWWFTVVLQCYHYFRDLNFRRSKQDVTMSFEAAKNFA
ncbi:hypothetical protein QR680_017936 [Steinernema hermaphroditum]|uniref:Uncharacterized protein n=1 Tax=Steinernema hermaphroditum TaxID=289476 RepID=A0AA39HH29_9BILA|nr:hypothetical protein QR680_017936 [Steinernema hermaphroditum]